MILNIIYLLCLFILLGLAADFLVQNISYIATALKIKLFAVGIILGIATSLPETSVAINASLEGIAGVSVGNLLGGIVVVLGLVLGASLMLNRKINTDGRLSLIAPQIIIMFIPLILGSDGNFGFWDGLIMILSYFSLLFYLYKVNHSFDIGQLVILEKNKIIRSIIFSIVGIVAILFFSHFIIVLTEKTLATWQVSKLTLGLLIFAVGTNLPEISIAITSWRKKTSELSLSHLLSSSFTNVLILGVMSILSPISFQVGNSYYILSAFLTIVLVLFVLFYRSDKKLDHLEGAILFSCYLLFLAANIWLLSF